MGCTGLGIILKLDHDSVGVSTSTRAGGRMGVRLTRRQANEIGLPDTHELLYASWSRGLLRLEDHEDTALGGGDDGEVVM